MLGHRSFELGVCIVDIFEDLCVDLEVHFENIALFNLALLTGLNDSHQRIQLGLSVLPLSLIIDALTLFFRQILDFVVLSPLVSPVLTHDAIGVTATHLDDFACEVYRQAKIDGSLQFVALLLSDAPPDTLFGGFVAAHSGLDGLGKLCLDGYLCLWHYCGHDLPWVIVLYHCVYYFRLFNTIVTFQNFAFFLYYFG